MHIMELRVLYRILHLLKVPALVNRRLGSTAKRQGGENNQLSLHPASEFGLICVKTLVSNFQKSENVKSKNFEILDLKNLTSSSR